MKQLWKEPPVPATASNFKPDYTPVRLSVSIPTTPTDALKATIANRQVCVYECMAAVEWVYSPVLLSKFLLLMIRQVPKQG